MGSGNLRILLVDDDPEQTRRLGAALVADGHSCVRAVDHELARTALLDECPHIVICGQRIQPSNDLDLCQWIRAQSLPHYVYTILLIRSDDVAKPNLADESSADDYLSLPINNVELIARVTSAARLIQLEQRLRRIAGTDPLTELPTRRTFFDLANERWEQGISMSCVMMDIDFFKRINDTLGHQAGDAMLRRVGEILRDSCRSSDLIARYGGEEFCVLLPEATESEAIAWAEKVRSRIAESSRFVEGMELCVTASVGVAERTADTISPEQFVDLADQALLIAKRSGRDRVVGFSAMSMCPSVAIQGDGPAAIFQGLSAKQVMTTIVAPLKQDDTVGRAARYFLRFRFQSAPVVDAAGKLVGMLSECDVMPIMLGSKWWNMKIRDVMKRNVISYDEDTPALLIYEFLSRVLIRGVVIVNDGRPTGLINRTSLLRWFTNRIRGRNAMDDTFQDESRNPVTTHDTEANIERIVDAIAEQSKDLKRRFESEEGDRMPLIVGGVSRLEELLNDLLACSRSASGPIPADQAGMISSPLATST